ncbi:MAG: CoA transferase subunit A [Chloroflexota bacterium]|nr:MAG: CoA transferase subunit A [Chloroflexota bacterium]
MIDKRATFAEAVSAIPSGSMLALGGMTNYRRPVAFVRSLIQHYQETAEPKDLTLLCFTAGLESDLLVGAGMVSRVRSCYFGLEIFGLAPMFTHYANRGEIEVVEETEASLALGLRATLAGIGFMPARAWIGTDLPKLRSDVKTITDPYTNETLMAFPAIAPDVAVIHAIKADWEGNTVIGKNKGVDQELSAASKNVIVTAEEVVPKLDEVDLITQFVDAVVHAPQGALPTSCHPLYQIDGEGLLAYVEQVSDPDSFAAYLPKFLEF